MWIFFAFLVWIYAFHGYLNSKFELTSDALSYYEHTKFFIENLGGGIYPLWDPYWFHGAPNDFFLRRIGSFNPFYLIILFFKSIGIPYTLSYLWFLACYYWSGMIAFYLLAMRLYQNRFIAYGGYLILLFSALGTRLFDSYMMLVTVPLIWFFYFLIAFSQTPRKHFFLGAMLSFMILASTYIPFYFLIILGLFLILFSVIYFDFIPAILHSYGQFFKENKILVFLSSLVLIFSFLPIILFFHDSLHGHVVLPIRHGDGSSSAVLTVPHQTLDWGVAEDFLYSGYFSDLRMYKFAVVYVPFFSIIVLVLGFIGRINRRGTLIFLWGILLLCFIIPYGLPFYNFFYNHLFFLKFFRNLHFFIWFFLIPVFVLLVLEHWHMFFQIKWTKPSQKWLLLMYVVAVHLGAVVFVWWRQDAVASTYIMIILSLLLWSLLVLKDFTTNPLVFILLTAAVLIQPLETYHYFSLKADPHIKPYTYDFSYHTFNLKNKNVITLSTYPVAKDTLYYSSAAYNFIYNDVSTYALEKYLQNKLILVDHVALIDRDNAGAVLEQNFLTNANTAVVFNEPGQHLKLNSNDPNSPLKAQSIDEGFKGFKLLNFDANHLRLKLNIPYEKFLVFNDSYDSSWHVTVNNHRAILYEANGAFKGVWLQAGDNVVEFSYGTFFQYAINILLSILAFLFLAGIIWYACLC